MHAPHSHVVPIRVTCDFPALAAGLPETFIMLEALRELACKDPSLPPKTGNQIENTILKMAVKVSSAATLSQMFQFDVTACVETISAVRYGHGVVGYKAIRCVEKNQVFGRWLYCTSIHS